MSPASIADDDQEARQEFSITGFHCNAFCGSFYSSPGLPDRHALQELEEKLPQQLLGWFVCRRGSWPQPTMREQQVSANLLSAMPHRPDVQPCLFMVLSPTQHHGGATFSLVQRLFCISPDRLPSSSPGLPTPCPFP